MDNAGLEKRDREQQYRLSLLRGTPDESLLRSEPHSEPAPANTAGTGKITAKLTVAPPPEGKKSELRRSKTKSSGRNRSKQH